MQRGRRYRAAEGAPWDRQPWETEESWQGFKLYRDYESKPSAARVAEDLGIPPSLSSHWCTKNLWKPRRAGFLTEIQRVKDEATLWDIAEAHKRHLAAARAMQALGKARVDEIAATPKARAKVGAAEAGKLISEGVKIDRLTMGEATERAGTELDLSKLTIDELDTLRALTEKARKL